MSDAHDIISRLGGHGILVPEDLPALDTQRGRVLALLSDGLWHSAEQIVKYAKGSEGLRRMRELRRLTGVTIERNRSPLSRMFYYRLVFTHPGQAELFVDERDAMTHSDQPSVRFGWTL